MEPSPPLQTLLARIAAQGTDIEQALQVAGAGRTGGRWPEAANRVVRTIWEKTDDELLGLGPRPIPRGMLRLLAVAVVHTRTLAEALARTVEFGRLATGIPFTSSTDEHRCMRIEFDPADAASPDPAMAGAILTGVHRFAEWLIGRAVPHAAIEPARLMFCAGSLHESVVRTEAELTQLLRDAPAGLLSDRSGALSVSGRVIEILERGPIPVTGNAVARELAVSPPHLRRLLGREGTSFRRLQDEILRDRAIAALTRTSEPIAHLATRLGYSEPSAFRRAFHRWTATTPSRYRSDAQRTLPVHQP
ncbi:helix-turn-helix domain-containing protein [Nocardia sp. GAS34]|uniref:helix-turn-helix transcriptional regulator n=1 Tax=unclassified Nocardia TaxID=2637762 RepID=UPI003D1E2810